MLTESELITSLDSELDFYRRRQFRIFASAVLLQVLLVTGQETIPLQHQMLTKIAYTFLFTVIVVFIWLFNRSYKTRIYQLRNAKIEICKKAGFGPVFPIPGKMKNKGKLKNTWSPSNLYVIIILLLSSLGLVIVWYSNPI